MSEWSSGDQKTLELMNDLENVLSQIMTHVHGDSILADGFIIQTTGSSIETGEREMLAIVRPGQSIVTNLGLLSYLKKVMKYKGMP